MQAHRFGYVIAGFLVVASSVSLWSLLAKLPSRTGSALPLQPGPADEAQTLPSGAPARAAPATTRVALPVLPPPAPQNPTAPLFWHPAEGPPPQLAGLQNGFVRDARHVRLDREAIAQLELGSLVPIELPSGERFLARVEHLAAHDNGDRSWSGHLEGFGLQYPVIYTQGESATFGTLVTPLGLFALEAQGDDAVLFRDEREGLQRPDTECQIIPG